MPTSSDGPLLLDTSAAIAFLLRSHDGHRAVHDAVAGQGSFGLAGHAVFETFSVLTRLPPPSRVSPGTALRLVEHNFPDTRHLPGERASRLLSEVAGVRIAGGAVYDALVAAATVEHGCRLVTRDRRALDTYAALGADVLLVE